MKKPTHLLLFVALLALPWATACGVECPLPMVKIDGFCQVPMDGGLDAGEGGTDAGRPDGGDITPDECGGSCSASEFCFEAACVENDVCSDTLGVPCNIFGPRYLKAGEPRSLDLFGRAVAISGDGIWLAVGAPVFIDPYYSASSDPEDTGAVYLFQRIDNAWLSRGQVPLDSSPYNEYGDSIALNSDGSVLAVGAPRVTVNGVTRAGQVHIYNRIEGRWVEVDIVTSAVPARFQEFGRSIALSGDGRTLAAIGIEIMTQIEIEGAGPIQVFENDGEWMPTSQLEKPDGGLFRSVSLDLNHTGTLLLAGESNADGPAGITRSGSVFVFRGTGAGRAHAETLRASDPSEEARFGSAVSLTGSGSRLAVGAVGDVASSRAGAVYVFDSDGSSWTETQRVVGSNTEASDLFGSTVDLSSDGDLLVVGAPFEAGAGLNLQSSDNNDSERSGAIYLFRPEGGSWQQAAILKASNSESEDRFGASVSIDGSGRWVVSGALDEDSDGSGTTRSPGNNSESSAGAAYIYRVRE